VDAVVADSIISRAFSRLSLVRPTVFLLSHGGILLSKPENRVTMNVTETGQAIVQYATSEQPPRPIQSQLLSITAFVVLSALTLQT